MRYINLRVFMVSLMLSDDGEMLPTVKVKVLLVRESCRSRVSLDYLKAGMFLLLLDRQWMTFPSVDSDRLIFLSSRKCS
jgi:hypothetical protein